MKNKRGAHIGKNRANCMNGKRKYKQRNFFASSNRHTNDSIRVRIIKNRSLAERTEFLQTKHSHSVACGLLISCLMPLSIRIIQINQK